MIEWKQMFEQDTLDRGRASYLNNRVVDLEKINGGYKAAVLGRERFEVSVKISGGSLGRRSCSCPAAKGGRNCEHMAAVLYAIEAKTRAEEEQKTEEMFMEQWRQLDEEARLREKQEAEEKRRQKAKREAARKKRQDKKTAEGTRQEEMQAAQAAEKARRQEKAKAEEARRQEKARAEEARRQEEVKAKEEALRLEKEREEKRLAREKRKAEKARREAEQKQKAEEARRIENEKRLAEEARREKIRQQKAEEAQRKAEKKKMQQEAQKLAEQKRLAEEKRRRREEMERQKAEEKRRQEEAIAAEEKYRQEEAQKRLEEQKRLADQAARLEQQRRNTEYTLLGSSWTEDSDPSAGEVNNESLKKLENYSYFDGTRIKNSMEISASVFKSGGKLLGEGSLKVERIFSGFDPYNSEPRGQLEATGKKGADSFPVRIMFSRTEVLNLDCGCPTCRRNYYGWYSKNTKCAYTAAALIVLETYLNTTNLGDATDKKGQRLINFYQEKRANRMMADVASKKESLQLVPRLMRKDDKLSVSFKIGENRLFVVKKLDDFCRYVKDSSTELYGTSTKINHSLSNFTEKGKNWIRFINRIVREEEEFLQRLQESRNYYGYQKSSVGSNLNLFGWRLDEFYEQLAEDTVEFEDKDSGFKKKGTVSCAEHNPKVTMRISAEKLKGDKEFHGVKVEGALPALYFGTDTAYYIENDHLNRVDRAFLDRIEPLANMANDNGFSFLVGRNHMSEFYHRILPQLQDIVDVKETEPERFRSYLLPDVRFIFYLDAEKENASCRVYARYGEKEVSVLDVIKNRETGGIEPFRDRAREEEIIYQVLQWFPEIDWQKDELHCGKDESLIYHVMEEGTEKLMEMGEVRCTKQFLGYRTVNRVKVSVGVSVSSGLLELDIASEDIPQKELLDILNSYRTKKKYYRLKDGSFVNLEDPSLEMLSELMSSMHMKPREFVKGKMHLPMYRTLYLDKMLEENDSVYSSRDSHFREVVKGFKTIKDADFEEPASLSRIMRKYQKNGYKWLRTLEAWQFGGILADDMGLGKTLQVIAVLLAAKEEGKAGTSLVVAPASLVFNWGEEFQRFAPDLKISLITGTQEERQGKIHAWQESDVLVTSYDLLKRDIAFYEEKEFLYEVIDEAQYIKNHTTAAAKAVKVIKSRTRYALTGTPIENRLSELWSIFDYLMPGFLYTYEVFKRELETPIVKNSDKAAVKRLQKMVSPFILRRLKEDVLKDLPEKLEEYRYVRFDSVQQKLYDGQVVHMKESIARQNDAEFNKNKMLILAELTRLRQICCDPSLCFENYKGEAAKLEACLQLIQSAMDGGHRMLVFSQFTSMLEILQNRLDEAGISYYTITGSTSKEKRLQMVKEFNEGDTPVFLISLKAGGVGLNLTGADVVIHYDPWWNLAVQNQATDRAHRIGQTKKVTVYKLIAKNTIEEKIQKLQETKKNLAEQVIGGEAGQLGSLSREEIMELLEV
ncbi:MAG: SNF2 helicase associated domain-containing protein [Eubacteriales bacterium]|nr:SNF2 helicase associated domain-containing protein [Eubacteriales bacterium]